MRPSRINPSFKFDEKTWVISVLNTTRSLVDGHSAIVVEGLEKDPLSGYYKVFIGQYDIATASEEGHIINPKGYITKIKCFENEKNTRQYEEEKYPAQSYSTNAAAAKRMILSIKSDARLTEQAMENWNRTGRNELKAEGEKEPLILGNDEKPIKPLRYQKLDKSHPLVKIFGDPEAGHNCTGWCLIKLDIAGIEHGDVPKPKFAAGQCSIL